MGDHESYGQQFAPFTRCGEADGVQAPRGRMRRNRHPRPASRPARATTPATPTRVSAFPVERAALITKTLKLATFAQRESGHGAGATKQSYDKTADEVVADEDAGGDRWPGQGYNPPGASKR